MGNPPNKTWVVGHPKSIARVYEDQRVYEAALRQEPAGYSCHQRVVNRETGEAMLEGTGIVLPVGFYAFTDGNKKNGVGIVLVEQDTNRFSVTEVTTCVVEVFLGSGLPGLNSEEEILEVSRNSAMGLAEIAAVHRALHTVPPGTSLTLVYDRREVASLFERGPEKEKRAPISAVVREWESLQRDKPLEVCLRHQYSHQKERVGRDDFAHWNNRADQLADQKPTHRDADRWFVGAGLRRSTIGEGRYSFEPSDS